MSNPKVHAGSPRFAELDGLRALAVASVVLFHCDISEVFNAGFFGVDVFFTISGFIITAILLKAYRQAGNFDFLDFYFRRLKRLLPPVLGLIVLAAALTPFISPDAYRRLVADAPAALFYYSNWWQIFEKQDYFDTTPHVLKHLWSLAVEEQFYIVWPPVAYLFLKRGGTRATGALALCLSLLSTAWMWYSFYQNSDSSDQNRIYLGTDTHAMGLLMGAALACFWNPWAERTYQPAARRVWRVLALAALAVLGTMMAVINTSDPFLYEGSFLLVPVLTCIIAYCTMNDRTFFVSWLLRTRVMQWMGLRSYSIYLVHWLVFVWMRLLGWTDFADLSVLLPGLAVVVVLAETMYRLVEAPFIRLDWKTPGALPKVATFAAYVLLAGGLTWASVALVETPAPVMAAGHVPTVTAAHTARVLPATAPATVAVVVPAVATVTAAPASAPASAVVPLATAAQAGDTAADPSDDPADAGIRISGGKGLYAIGDSVLLGASAHLARTIPGIQVDAAVGRQASQGLKVVQQWHGKLNGNSTVLVHLGTNGYINERQFRELLAALADCKLVLVMNVHADRRWTAPNNEIIDRMARDFPNVHLIDWRLVSARRPDYFVKDGIHLTHRGILALASQIKVATGGAPLPELGTDTRLASVDTHRAARKADAAGVDAGVGAGVGLMAEGSGAAAPPTAVVPAAVSASAAAAAPVVALAAATTTPTPAGASAIAVAGTPAGAAPAFAPSSNAAAGVPVSTSVPAPHEPDHAANDAVHIAAPTAVAAKSPRTGS